MKGNVYRFAMSLSGTGMMLLPWSRPIDFDATAFRFRNRGNGVKVGAVCNWLTNSFNAWGQPCLSSSCLPPGFSRLLPHFSRIGASIPGLRRPSGVIFRLHRSKNRQLRVISRQNRSIFRQLQGDWRLERDNPRQNRSNGQQPRDCRHPSRSDRRQPRDKSW